MQVLLREMEVLSGGLQIAMSEQNLDSPQVRACFQQMRRPAMTKSVRRHALGDTRLDTRILASNPHRLIADWAVWFQPRVASREQIRLGFAPAPVLAQGFQKCRAEWQIAASAALALVHANQHALAIHVLHS